MRTAPTPMWRRRLATPLVLILLLTACRTDSDPGTVEPAVPAKASETAEAPAPPISDDPSVVALVSSAREESRVDEHVRQLVEEFGPRLTSSHALQGAERWAVERFDSWGLDARLERWGSFPVGFDRGEWRGGMVRPERIDYDFTTMAWTPGTREPVRGQAVLYPGSVAELEAMAPRFPGAWLVHPPGQNLDARLRARIDREVERAGVAGEVFAAGPQGELRVHTWGIHSVEWDDLPTRVRVHLRGDQHHDLVERLRDGLVVQLQFEIDNHMFKGPVPQHNVVADLEGWESPEEFVIVGGHLDSWDGATGAVDNGTGVATTMEAARLLAGLETPPRRTIRFILWTGEEQGLLGSKAYVEQNPEIMDRVSAVYVHDEGTNPITGIHVTPEMRPAMEQVFAPVRRLSTRYPFELIASESLVLDASDHAPFIRAGVPGFFWVQSGPADYERVHHTQYDHLEEVVPEYQRHSALVVAIAAWNTAQLPALIERRNSKPLHPRGFGVYLERNEIVRIIEGERAEALGWQVGDRIVEIDGKAVTTAEQIAERIDLGGSKKRVAIERSEERLEFEADFSSDPDEAERLRRRAERELGEAKSNSGD